MIDSKTEFANMLEIPMQTYVKWENNKSYPNLDLAFTIAKKLNKEVTEIWYQEQIPYFFTKKIEFIYIKQKLLVSNRNKLHIDISRTQKK